METTRCSAGKGCTHILLAAKDALSHIANEAALALFSFLLRRRLLPMMIVSVRQVVVSAVVSHLDRSAAPDDLRVEELCKCVPAAWSWRKLVLQVVERGFSPAASYCLSSAGACLMQTGKIHTVKPVLCQEPLELPKCSVQ